MIILTLIGNDIVDLKSSETVGKSEDLRFMERVFNSSEQRMVFNTVHPDSILWALWAAKESAYKAVSKFNPVVGSAPKHYPVKLNSLNNNNVATGTVVSPIGPVVIKIEFHQDYVHCLGLFGPKSMFSTIVYSAEPISKKDTGGKSTSEIESAAVRYLAAKRLASYLKMAVCDISIVRLKKNNQRMPPKVYAKGHPQPMDISLSHDGRFAAYGFLPG